MTVPGNTIAGAGNDPLLGQSFFLDLGGMVQGFFTQCSGLSSSNEVIVNKSVDISGRTRIRKIPGPVTYGNITLSQGITASTALWEWVTAIASGKHERKNGTISLVDPTGAVVAEWTLVAVWPMRVTSPSMSADGGKVGLEELELAIEGFTRVK